MVKLIIKLILFSLIIGGICYSTFYLNPEYKNNYLASISMKLEKLKRIKEKKIVIIGGSNVCFGLNSDEIENSLGIPVVNMGLHASLGPKFWIEYVKSNLNAGDILIMSPEYGMLKKEDWYGMKGTAVPKTIIYTPSKLHILLTDYSFFQKTVVGIFRTVKAYWKNFPFEQDPFNLKKVYDLRSFKGDNIKSVYLNSVNKKKYSKQLYEFSLEEDAWEQILRYKEYFDDKDVSFYISPPSIMDESVDVSSAKEYLKQFSFHSKTPILNDNLDYFYKRGLFFDTNYHLNKRGINYRTKSLTKDIADIFYKGLRVPDKKEIFLSQYDFEKVSLDSMNDKLNVKLQYFGNDSIYVTPTRDDAKMGFVKYRTPPQVYIGNLFKLTVRAKPEVIDKLKFFGVPSYGFDYIKKTDEKDTYILCKSLSNTINNPKTFEFSVLGIGFVNGELQRDDHFTITKAQIIKINLDCDEIGEYNNIYQYNVPNNVEKLFFEISKFEGKSPLLKDVVNTQSQIEIKNNTKYFMIRTNSQWEIHDFYGGKKIAKLERGQKCIFKNDSKFQQEIKITLTK